MKNIAVFCDGTWNSLDAPDKTNPAILSESLHRVARITGEDGQMREIAQKSLYVPGVGTRMQKASAFENAVYRVTGGAFGWGLDAKLAAAYRDLAECHEPGDRIYLFGFSRGAYMARSLAGLIRNCGLPPKAQYPRIDEAIRRYRARAPSSHPDAPESLLFRETFSPDLATSEVDRIARGRPVGMLSIAYMGIWDTVGALGVPEQFAGLAAVFNKKYRFHDLRLSSMVKAARHAVAIDERRKTFPPSLWENLKDLNGDDPQRHYRQEWFPGNHGSVGGGGPIKGLSHAALLWVVDGARDHGLAVREDFAADWQRGVDVGAPLDNHPGRKGAIARWLESDAADRAAPPSIHAISDVAKERWKRFDYRPVPLRPFAPRMDPPVMPGDWGGAR